MRQIVVFNRVSADGYFASNDGNLDWTVPDEAIDQAGAARMQDFDTMLFGRHTYEAFESFWPHAEGDSDSANDPHTQGRRSKTLRSMASWINQTPKWLFSTSKQQLSWQNSRLFPKLDPAELRALKHAPGKNMIVFGSGSLVAQLTQHGLIDEYQFIVGPVLLGSGRSLIQGVAERVPLELLEAKPYASGNVMLRYARRN
jgi:dihydrofolate reductase